MPTVRQTGARNYSAILYLREKSKSPSDLRAILRPYIIEKSYYDSQQNKFEYLKRPKTTEKTFEETKNDQLTTPKDQKTRKLPKEEITTERTIKIEKMVLQSIEQNNNNNNPFCKPVQNMETEMENDLLAKIMHLLPEGYNIPANVSQYELIMATIQYINALQSLTAEYH